MPPQADDDLLNSFSRATDPGLTHNDPSYDEPSSEIPDLPPESFWVPEEQAIDWFNRNAFIERKGSTKITASGNLNSGPRHSFQGSPSQRFSLNSKAKASIIGLPKFQKSSFADRNLRRSFKPGNVRLFRSRSEPGGKPVAQASEPGSPMVSCMGKVRSKKGRCKRTGLWASLRAIFRTGLGGKRVVNSKGSSELNEPDIGPAGFVGSKRLESRARSESWGGK